MILLNLRLNLNLMDSKMNKKLMLISVVLFSMSVFAEEKSSTTITNVSTTGVNPSTNTISKTSSTTVSTSTTTMPDAKDDDIVSAVYAKYAKDQALIGTHLTVTCKNRMVTVSGTVTAQAQADEAIIAAKSVPGVKDALSNINVITNPGFNKPVKSIPHY